MRSDCCAIMRGVLAYAEDPCGAEDGLFRTRGHGRVPSRDRATDGDQHGRHRLAAADPRTGAAVGRYPARRPALLDHGRLCAGRTDVPRLGPHMGFALEQSLRRVPGDVHACRRSCARARHRDRYALDLAGRSTPDPGAAADRRRQSGSADAAGPRYRTGHGRSRKGACSCTRSTGWARATTSIAMQYLVPGWTFDPKRPCLVR